MLKLKLQNKQVYSSYTEFYKCCVLPIISAHPQWKRLHGDRKTGFPKKVGYFWHNAAVWYVHDDSIIETLKKAYQYRDKNPFREEEGKNTYKLKLKTMFGELDGCYIYRKKE